MAYICNMLTMFAGDIATRMSSVDKIVETAKAGQGAELLKDPGFSKVFAFVCDILENLPDEKFGVGISFLLESIIKTGERTDILGTILRKFFTTIKFDGKVGYDSGIRNEEGVVGDDDDEYQGDDSDNADYVGDEDDDDFFDLVGLRNIPITSEEIIYANAAAGKGYFKYDFQEVWNADFLIQGNGFNEGFFDKSYQVVNMKHIRSLRGCPRVVNGDFGVSIFLEDNICPEESKYSWESSYLVGETEHRYHLPKSAATRILIHYSDKLSKQPSVVKLDDAAFYEFMDTQFPIIMRNILERLGCTSNYSFRSNKIGNLFESKINASLKETVSNYGPNTPFYSKRVAEYIRNGVFSIENLSSTMSARNLVFLYKDDEIAEAYNYLQNLSLYLLIEKAGLVPPNVKVLENFLEKEC